MQGINLAVQPPEKQSADIRIQLQTSQERIDRIGVGEMSGRRRQGRAAGEIIGQDVGDADAAAGAERRVEQQIARIPAVLRAEIGEHRANAGQMRRDGANRLLFPADMGITGGHGANLGGAEHERKSL